VARASDHDVIEELNAEEVTSLPRIGGQANILW
jgi:hypothetical protein